MLFTPEAIKERCRQKPFTPFRILTSGGDAFDVTHPDLAWVGTRDVHVGTSHSTSPSLYDTVARIALMHITGMVDLPVASGPPKSNGQSS